MFILRRDLMSRVSDESFIGSVIGNFRVCENICAGGFGLVYTGYDIDSPDKKVAIKVFKNAKKHAKTVLINEARVYAGLNSDRVDSTNIFSTDKIFVPKTLYIDNCVIMPLFGESLDKLIREYTRFSLQTTILLAIQMIDILKFVHSRGYIHKDIKPANFIFDNNSYSHVYCVDFGLSSKYIDSNGKHVECIEKTSFHGTARYASIAAHKFLQQSRKDDLESLGYVLVYLYKGSLPWEKIKSNNTTERNKEILRIKSETTPDQLCENMPREFVVFLKYARNLDFDERPLYSSLSKMFKNLYESRDYVSKKMSFKDKIL